MTSSPGPITNGGRLDRAALDALYSAAYEELHQLAKSIKYSRPPSTMTPSTLVQEAWIRLAKSGQLAHYSETQFKYIAAQAMYDILVEAARRRSTEKRGGKIFFVTLDPSLDVADSCSRDILALRDWLDELYHLNRRQADIVKSKCFGGLETAEIASLLGIAESTVARDWRVAKAWLKSRIHRTE